MLALKDSELNNISESNLVSESLPAVIQNQKTGENITNLQINVGFKPDDSHLPHISNKNETLKQRTNNRQSIGSQLSLDLVEEANLEPKPIKFDMEGTEENQSQNSRNLSNKKELQQKSYNDYIEKRRNLNRTERFLQRKLTKE